MVFSPFDLETRSSDRRIKKKDFYPKDPSCWSLGQKSWKLLRCHPNWRRSRPLIARAVTRASRDNGGNLRRRLLAFRCSGRPRQSIRQVWFCCTRTTRQLSGRTGVCLLLCFNGFGLTCSFVWTCVHYTKLFFACQAEIICHYAQSFPLLFGSGIEFELKNIFKIRKNSLGFGSEL